MPRKPSAAAEFIGERIKKARTDYTLTHDQLAARTGIDSSNIRSYESGRATPNIHTLIRIAAAMGIPPGFFIDGLVAEQFDMPHSRNRAS